MNKHYDVVTVGNALRDILFLTDQCRCASPRDVDPLAQRLLCVEFGAKVISDDVVVGFGGGAMNTAINFSLLGLRTAIVASVGNDDDGRAIMDRLARFHVRAAFMQCHPSAQTGFTFLLIDKHSGEHSALIHYGAAATLRMTNTLAHVNTRWLYVTSLHTSSWRSMCHTLFTGRQQVVWNPGATQLHVGLRQLQPLLRTTSILLVNRDEAIELLQSDTRYRDLKSIVQMLKALFHLGPQIVVITNGHRGAYCYDGTRVHHTTPTGAAPVDTTGAGDCFGSSFVAGMIRYNNNCQRALDLATTAASRLVQRYGAQEGLTPWQKLPRRLGLENK